MIKSKIFLASLLLVGCTKKAPPPSSFVPTVEVTTAKRMDMPVYKEYVGHIEASISVQLMPQVSGKIIAIPFKEGEKVEKGEILFSIEPQRFQATLMQAQGALRESEANLTLAENQVKRFAPLLQQNFISQLDFDKAVTQVKALEGEVMQNRAAVELAKINLGYCSVRSPISGVAGIRQTDIGNLVSPTVLLVTINALDSVYAKFTVPENDLREIQSKMKKSTLVVNIDDTNLQGDLNLADNQVNGSTGSIDLRATINNKERKVWPGQFVPIRLHLDTLKDVIVVPSHAVAPGNIKPFVFVIDHSGKAEKRDVVIGPEHKNQLVILKGVAENEKVVVKGAINLKPGTAVKMKETL